MEERFKRHDVMLMGIYIVFAMVAFIVIVNHERLNKIENTTSTCGCEVVVE